MTLESEYNDLVEWVRLYGSDVDHTAFTRACDSLSRRVFQEKGLRYPNGLVPGLPTLDVALSLQGKPVPTELCIPGLPGYAFYNGLH